jgi:hypothetical protein
MRCQLHDNVDDLIDLGCGFAVAGSVAVMYDWGEQDQV